MHTRMYRELFFKVDEERGKKMKSYRKSSSLIQSAIKVTTTAYQHAVQNEI